MYNYGEIKENKLGNIKDYTIGELRMMAEKMEIETFINKNGVLKQLSKKELYNEINNKI